MSRLELQAARRRQEGRRGVRGVGVESLVEREERELLAVIILGVLRG